MRERGVQSRRVRPGPVVPGRTPGPPQRGGGNFWQAVAIIALIAATAGWTTVAVLALRPGPSAEAVASDSLDSFDPNASDNTGSEPPVADTHDVPALEAALPTALTGTALQVQSWKGDGVLTDDAWSTSMTTFLTSSGKTAADLQVAQAYDPNQALDGSIGVYRVVGLPATAVRDALIQAWKGDYPDMKVSDLVLGGATVTKGDFGADTIASYLYLRGDLVYDIETTDEKVATAAIAALPAPGASGAPAPSGSPKASVAPAASPS